MKKLYYLFLAVLCLVAASCTTKSDNVIIYPAPEGEVLSSDYVVTADGQNVPVYNVRVPVRDREERHKGIAKAEHSHEYYELASIAYFDLKQGPVTVTVSIDKNIETAKILPTSFGIEPQIAGNKLTFQVNSPQNLTIDINGEYVRSLHLFVNPEEKNIPDPNDPNVIYFGPGIHEITSLEVGDNKTVYVAGGAIVRGIVGADEEYRIEDYSGLKIYKGPTINLKGNNITLRGRGIIDQTQCPTHARNLVRLEGNNINVEGVILHNSSVWTMPVHKCNNVLIDNIKLIGYRANADGIDICASHDVTVQNSFIRTMDDLIVVKAPKGTGEAGRIVAKNCVLWNEVAHALSIGAEITDKVEDVLFTDCDIIHDHCREWSLRVYQTDGGLVKNIRFENLRIEESVRFASLWIGEAVWTTDKERGHIQDVVFKNITANGKDPLFAEFLGYDQDHKVDNVLIENVVINGKPFTENDLRCNEFVENVTIK